MGLRRKTGILTAFLLLIVLTVNPVFAAAVTGNTPVESVLQTEAVPADAHEGTAENEGMPEEAVQTDKDEDTEENGEKSEVSDVLQESDDAESAEEVTPEEVPAGEENTVEESAAEEVKSSEDSMPSPESQVPAAQKEETSSETSLSVPAGTETPEEAAEPEEALLTALEEEPVEEVLTPFEPEDGIYTIRTALSSSFVWDVPSASCEAGTAIQLYKSNGTDAQKYRILKNADKTYRIVNVKSDKALQTVGGSDKAGIGVAQNFIGTAACQKWLFFKDSEGLVQIVSALPGKYCISVENAKAANKAKLLTAVPVLEKENAGSQRFELQLLKTAAQDKPDTVKEGVYILRSALDTSMVMDVSGAKKTAGANVQLYKYNGTNAQKYIITQSGSNTFRIVNLNSFMAVGTQGHKTASATNVEQDVMADAATQDWAFEPADRG